jgi:hypothetical protein
MRSGERITPVRSSETSHSKIFGIFTNAVLKTADTMTDFKISQTGDRKEIYE